jgi:hypothetical protein
MPNPEFATLAGLFVAGLSTSLHCAGMCGLLTCGLGIAGQGSALASVGCYHAFRLCGYGIAGAMAGSIGAVLGIDFQIGGLPWYPLLLVGFLLAITFGLDKKLGTIPFFGRLSMRLRVTAFSLPPLLRAAVVGIATPLLPCGPLYAILAIALTTASPVKGAETMLIFGFGAIPAIALVQLGSAWTTRKIGANGFLIAKRSLALCGAASLVWHFSLLNAQAKNLDEGEGATCRCELEKP